MTFSDLLTVLWRGYVRGFRDLIGHPVAYLIGIAIGVPIGLLLKHLV